MFCPRRSSFLHSQLILYFHLGPKVEAFPSIAGIMSKILVVFGATGQQGGSVIDYILKDPQLSTQYTIRGVTRDLSKPAVHELQRKGIEVVKGDFEDNESLTKAMQGAHTVFGMTATVYDGQIMTREVAEGKALADAAVTAGVQYFIWSTLPHVAKISGGKYQQVENFDVKAEVEQYIRKLPIKSSFFAPGSFMQNFTGMMAPHPLGDGTYAISSFVSAQTQLPLVDAAADSGKWVAAILAEPEKYEGKVLSAATRIYSYEEIVEIISRATGKTVRYNQIPETVFRSFLPPAAADQLTQMLSYFQDFGYYGPETKEEVAWTAQQARGKLTTFEEYVGKNLVHLLK